MAKLVINPTSAAKKEIPIASKVISIGRDPSNDLVLSDSMVSRRHAILEQRDNIYVLRDNNSSNGTLVNGDKVDAEKTLRDGDLLAIGSSRLLFQLDDTLSGAPEPARPLEPVAVRVDAGQEDSLGDGPSESLESRPGGSCPTCHNKVLPSDRFCRTCGAALAEKKSVNCTACGTVVPLPAEFCGNCGHEIQKRPRPVPPTRHLNRSDLLADQPIQPEAESAPASSRPRSWPKNPRRASAREEEAAGFGIRAVAAIIDGLIVGIPMLLVTLLVSMVSMSSETGASAMSAVGLFISLVFPLLGFAYYVFFWGLHEATPGKSLLGLTVQSVDGESPIGLGRAAVRALGYLVSGAVFGIGFLMIAFSDDKRGLHDRIAGTRVMRNL